MTMKGVRFSFEASIEELLLALAKIEKGRKMKIEPIYDALEAINPGTLALPTRQAIMQRVNGPSPKNMKRVNRHGKTPSRVLILNALTTGEALSVSYLVGIAINNGTTKSAASGALDWMKKRKWVKRVAPGTWQITPLGKQQVESA